MPLRRTRLATLLLLPRSPSPPSLYLLLLSFTGRCSLSRSGVLLHATIRLIVLALSDLCLRLSLALALLSRRAPPPPLGLRLLSLDLSAFWPLLSHLFAGNLDLATPARLLLHPGREPQSLLTMHNTTTQQTPAFTLSLRTHHFAQNSYF